ncbi:hypothetical protein [Segniliparus rugosus]|uniref:hypothetical protein n=1 Tax=Segniliparus rugosus TaxID=286804 RepID=UPI00146FB464|nr:hypothetical protein [Segniliparus rugosus]
MSVPSRRSGAELLEQELDRLRRAASGPGLIGSPMAEDEPPEPEAAPGPAQPVPLSSWIAMASALLFGLLLVRLVGWLFDFPTDTLDARDDSPVSGDEYQLLLFALAISVMLVVFADVAAVIWVALGSGIASARQALGCCGILAAALAAYPWDAAVWLSDVAQQRHTVRDVVAVLLAGAAVFWLYPRVSRVPHVLIATVVVWELVAPYRLGWVEEPTTAWFGPDPAAGVAVLRVAALVPVYFTVVAACALVARGSGPRRIWHQALGMLALVLGALLLMPWSRFLWADSPPQEHQLVGWALAGTLIVAQGAFLLTPSNYDGTIARNRGGEREG